MNTIAWKCEANCLWSPFIGFCDSRMELGLGCEKNLVFMYFGLIKHCYLLILVNELRGNELKMKTLKN